MKFPEVFLGSLEERVASASLKLLEDPEELSKAEVKVRNLRVRQSLLCVVPLVFVAGLAIFEANKRRPSELAEAINALPQTPLKSTDLSENPDAPFFILAGDTHGSPEIEKKKIEALRKELGINFVGVEGWAGKEADEERGYLRINAETKLITALMDDQNFKVVPLEDPDQQEEALKALFVQNRLAAEYARSTILLITAISSLTDYGIPLDPDGLKNAVDLHIESEISADYIISKRFNIHDCDEPSHQQCDDFTTSALAPYGVSYSSLPQNTGEENLNYALRLQDYLKPALDKINEVMSGPLVVDDRSQIGAQKMWDAMEKSDENVGVIIFGDAHIPQIHQELKTLGDCSVVEI